MFRTLSQFFGSFLDRSLSGRRARGTLRRAALFGGLLLAVWLGAEYLLPSPAAEKPPVISDGSGTVATSSPEESAPEDWNPGIVLAVLLLGGGIALAVHLRRRSDQAPREPAALMNVVGRQSLGSDRELLLVACADEMLLLGVSSEGVRLLKSYAPDRFPDHRSAPAAPGGDGAASAAPSLDSQAGGLGRSFTEVLRQYASLYSAESRN